MGKGEGHDWTPDLHRLSLEIWGGGTGGLWNGALEAETSLRRTAKDQPKDVKHLKLCP